MEFNELMQQFAAKIGISDITIEDGSVALAMDGIPVGFLGDDSAGTLIIVADIGRQPESADRPLGSMMLKANFLYQALEGAVLFQNPENDAFGIQQRFRLADLDADALFANVERLANHAESWREIVAGYGQIEAAAKDALNKEPEASSMHQDSFMRV